MTVDELLRHLARHKESGHAQVVVDLNNRYFQVASVKYHDADETLEMRLMPVKATRAASTKKPVKAPEKRVATAAQQKQATASVVKALTASGKSDLARRVLQALIK